MKPQPQSANPEQPALAEAPAAASDVTRLLIVRHGETTWNAAARVQGQLNPGLSDTGLRQARQLARRLAREPIQAIYSSDLLRAEQTAQAVAGELGLPVRLAPGFREAGFGEWEGLTTPEIQARFPDAYRRWRADAIAHRPPGGETIEALRERVMAAARQVIDRHPGESVLIVAHGGPVRCLVVGLMELPLAVYPRLRIDNAGITRIWLAARGPILAGFNATDHLHERGFADG